MTALAGLLRREVQHRSTRGATGCGFAAMHAEWAPGFLAGKTGVSDVSVRIRPCKGLAEQAGVFNTGVRATAH